jgi:hypothetical protein
MKVFWVKKEICLRYACFFRQASRSVAGSMWDIDGFYEFYDHELANWANLTQYQPGKTHASTIPFMFFVNKVLRQNHRMIRLEDINYSDELIARFRRILDERDGEKVNAQLRRDLSDGYILWCSRYITRREQRRTDRIDHYLFPFNLKSLSIDDILTRE